MSKTFTTSAGREVTIVSVPPLLIDVVKLRAMKSVEVPPIPTYEVELEDGTKLKYAHDEKSIIDPTTSEDERKAWGAYQAALRQQVNAASNKVLELFMAKGVVVDDDEVMHGSWRELQDYFGIELPTELIPARLHFVRTELLTSTEDINGLMSAILEASGIDPTILEAAQNSFRSNVRLQEAALARLSRPVPAEGEGEVVHELPLPGSGNSESVGVNP